MLLIPSDRHTVAIVVRQIAQFHKRARIAVASILVGLAGIATAHAAPVGMHAVKYVVSSDVPAEAEIYYRDSDPPDFADYSHNPYQYSPKAEASVAPRAAWQRDVALVNPDQWAMVSVSNTRSSGTPTFRCELIVDGVIAARNQGPRGALCSLRLW